MNLLHIEQISKRFQQGFRKAPIEVVSKLSLDIAAGSSMALVGESGAGKTTVARAICGLTKIEQGRIFVGAHKLNGQSNAVQMVFQNPKTSLNPRMKIVDILLEPFLINRITKQNALAEIKELIAQVQIEPGLLDRYPHQLSGGQQQRIAIARAIALKPKLLILDEPFSSLDYSFQEEIIGLLSKLRKQKKLTYLLITHNLGVAKSLCDNMAVMYLGSIVEKGNLDNLLNNVRHPFTQALVSSAYGLKKVEKNIILKGEPQRFEQGCNFQNRCWQATDICLKNVPQLQECSKEHLVACHNQMVARQFGS